MRAGEFLAVRKVATKNDEHAYGISYAVRELGYCAATIRKWADAGELHCIRDSTGRRLFRRSDLEKFKRVRFDGNRRRYDAEVRPHG